jgi:hypothetical protein
MRMILLLLLLSAIMAACSERELSDFDEYKRILSSQKELDVVIHYTSTSTNRYIDRDDVAYTDSWNNTVHEYFLNGAIREDVDPTASHAGTRTYIFHNGTFVCSFEGRDCRQESEGSHSYRPLPWSDEAMEDLGRYNVTRMQDMEALNMVLSCFRLTPIAYNATDASEEVTRCFSSSGMLLYAIANQTSASKEYDLSEELIATGYSDISSEYLELPAREETDT